MTDPDAAPVHVTRTHGRTFRVRLEDSPTGAWLTVEDVELAYALTPPRFPVDRQGRLNGAPSRPAGPGYVEAVGRALHAFIDDGVLGADDGPELEVMGTTPDDPR